MKHKIILLFWVFSSILFLPASVQAQADEGQFYFTATSASLGASSQTGSSGRGVYLRWDIVEGVLPADIVRLELKRNGSPILTKNINEVMSEKEIHNMYSGAAEQQRLLQTINLLKKLSIAQGEQFDVSNFPAELIKRFNNINDKAWVFLASRQNFNIARARYRAFLDTQASGKVIYTLTAFDAAGTAAQLGEVTVDASVTKQQLLAVNNFHQIEKNTCGIVNTMQDHYTVFLDWVPAGNSITDNAVVALQNAGYLIYRGTSNLSSGSTQPPLRDIAAEARTLNHDQRGDIVFADLERVNSSLIISQGHRVSSMDNPAFFESPVQLAAAGVKPGDKRAYYIVAVDFAGHFGQTAGAIIQVPDRQMPATPWNIKFNQRMQDVPEANLEWDESTVANYAAYYSSNRIICNAAEAAVSSKIEYANDLQDCENARKTRVDISTYLVYRFDSAQQANRFADSDGDGFANSDEISNQGNACDASSKPSGNVTNFLIKQGDYKRINLPNNRTKIRYNVFTNAQSIGKTYWYRIASRTADGNISPLSAPLYGIFWDRELPPKPTFTAMSTGNCCKLGQSSNADWRVDDNVKQLGSLSLAFTDNPGSQTSPISFQEFADPTSSVCSDKNSPISAFWGTSNASRELIYPGLISGSQQQAYCRVSIPNDLDLCQSGGWVLAKTRCEEPVSNGDIVDSPTIYRISAAEAGNCVSVYRRILGQSTRVATSCGTGAASGGLEYTADPGFCGYTQEQDASGNLSPIQELPCTVDASQSPPSPPQIILFKATADRSDYSWRLPLEPTAITLIEISSDVNDAAAQASDRQTISVPNAGFNPSKLFTGSQAIHTLIGVRDQWCIRMKAIAPTANDVQRALSSDWSNRVCSTRRLGSNVSTEYMPWPKVEMITMQKGLNVKSAKDSVGVALGMAYEKMPFIISFAFPVDDTAQSQCAFQGVTENRFEQGAQNAGELLFSRSVVCGSLKTIENLQKVKMFNLPFMVYRQARTPQGQKGAWIQVSPLIDNVHWEFGLTAKGPSWSLDDPYFSFFRMNYSLTALWSLYFVDRYPHISGYEYRYQVVSFSENHAIDTIYFSADENDPWVKAAELGAMQ